MGEAGTARSRAAQLALEDDQQATLTAARRFALGTRPVIRWVKGDGRDDVVTRAAIGQATRLFGDSVDYCLCTNGIDAARVRWILEWATQPVKWWPVSPEDNEPLAAVLAEAGCQPSRFGYWWKWFPERVRPNAPEWILDGDMVVTRPPEWFDDWREGRDVLRVTQDDRWPMAQLYGGYDRFIDTELRLYSGLVSLPPGQTYMAEVLQVLEAEPLAAPHDGTSAMSEQGVIATAFQRLAALPIPLYEFPFARAFEPALDHGLHGDIGRGWGYHFGHAFRAINPHFTALARSGEVLALDRRPDAAARTAWLGARTQWGIPGWSMSDAMARLIEGYARDFAGCRVLELGTSRGHLTTVLAQAGCRVITLDRHDRGAAQNLAALEVTVVQAPAEEWLAECEEVFDLIVVDLHGNSPEEWDLRGALLLGRLAPDGLMLISNATLGRVQEWHAETGVPHFLSQLSRDWSSWLHETPQPGLAVVTRASNTNRSARRGDAALHLVADGEAIWPAGRDGERHRFRLMAPVRDLRLRSRHDIPRIARPHEEDDRRLGVGIRRIFVEAQGFTLILTPDWPGYGRGFHASEGTLRWTDGDGHLALEVLAQASGPVRISIDAYEMVDYPAPMPAPARR
jgi:predicted O-methyltransferase YrrM